MYTPSDCFETFPFPEHYEQNEALEQAGRAYYEFRAALMVRNSEGLTKTYNRFHRPDEYTPEIVELRRFHAAMDRAVLAGYGWHDLLANDGPRCEFCPEFENAEEDDEAPAKGRAKQKKYRYRWPDEVHDEVLARLLALNRERAGAIAQTKGTSDEAEEPPEETAAPASPLRSSAKQEKAPGRAGMLPFETD